MKNKRGQTPLQAALRGGGRGRGVADVGPDAHQQTVDLLRELGAESAVGWGSISVVRSTEASRTSQELAIIRSRG